MINNILPLFITSFIGWVICGSLILGGTELFNIGTALIIHDVLVPILFFLLFRFYYKKYAFTSPLNTAFIVLIIILLLDIFITAMLIQKSFEMFESFIGTWLPFILIFAAVYSSGIPLKKAESLKI